MSDLKAELDRKKTIEVILYIANRLKNPDKFNVGKLLYFADKTSLERYGRLICGETYAAMNYGPVPSIAYDMMKEASMSNQYGFTTKGQNIVPLREPDLSELSNSDIECLNIVIDTLGGLGWYLSELSHDNAYHEAWDERGIRGSMPMSIESIIRTLGLEQPDELIDFVLSPDSDDF